MNTTSRWHKMDLDAPVSDGNQWQERDWENQRFGDSRLHIINTCTRKWSNPYVMSEHHCAFMVEKLVAQTKAAGVIRSYECGDHWKKAAQANVEWWTTVDPKGWIAQWVTTKPSEIVWIDGETLVVHIPTERDCGWNIFIPNHGWGYICGCPSSPSALRLKKAFEEIYE